MEEVEIHEILLTSIIIVILVSFRYNFIDLIGNIFLLWFLVLIVINWLLPIKEYTIN